MGSGLQVWFLCCGSWDRVKHGQLWAPHCPSELEHVKCNYSASFIMPLEKSSKRQFKGAPDLRVEIAED